jgi:hypothetical protein
MQDEGMASRGEALAMQRILLGLGVVAVLVGGMAQAARGQPEAGSKPYTVVARYRIDAGRTQRYRHYQAMLQRLAAAGFVKDKGLEGEEFYGEQISGTMPLAGKAALLSDPVLRTSLMAPSDYKPPEAAGNTALVRLYLSTEFSSARQRELADKTLALLKPLGFVEAPAYHHQGNRLLIGRLPFDKLPDLLKETMEVEIPLGLGQEHLKPFKTAAIKVAEVLPEPGDYAPLAAAETDPPVPAEKPYLEKISPDLRRQMARLPENEGSKVVRIEMVLRTTPEPYAISWRIPFINPPLYMDIEGRLGPVVTGRISYAYLEELARRPEVSTIRLPHLASPILPPDYTVAAIQAEKPFRVVPLVQAEDTPRITEKTLQQQVGPKRTVIIGTDFRGYAQFVGKGLPAKTEVLDLTIELNPELLPLPQPDDGRPVGESTLLALAYVQQHPTEELILARVEPTSPGQVMELAKVLNGGVWNTEALAQRVVELNREQIRLQNEQFQLQVQRRILGNNYPTERGAEARAAWDKYAANRQKVLDAIGALGEQMARYNQFVRQVRLRRVQEVLLAVNWTEGYPNLANRLPILRYLDQELLKSAVWSQAVPVRTGQVWTGLFRDNNKDGVMEFAPLPDEKRPDLNFLEWQPRGGAREANLPQGLVVEATVSWHEAHDPRLFLAPDDPFRRPIAPLQIVLLRQRDPEGKVLPADIFEEVARTTAWPERLENAPRWATYQALLRYQVQRPGRYALRIEGQAPTTTLPVGSAEIQSERSELRPKLVVEAADPGSRQKGRVLLETFRTGE